MASLKAEPETVLIKNYEAGVAYRRDLRLVNVGSAPAKVTVFRISDGSATSSLRVQMFRVSGFPREPAPLVIPPGGGTKTVTVEFYAPPASSKQPRSHSYTAVFLVEGGADLAVPVRTSPAPPQLFDPPPPRVLDFGKVPADSQPRRTYRFRCALPGKHSFRLFVSGGVADGKPDFTLDPDSGSFGLGDVMPLTVAFSAARAGQSWCRVDAVVTTVNEDASHPVVRRFTFDVSGFAIPKAEPPPEIGDAAAVSQKAQQQPRQLLSTETSQALTQQPGVASMTQTAPSINGTRPPKAKTKKQNRAPRDQHVVSLEAAFRREISEFEEQLAQRLVRTTRTPGTEPPTPADVSALLAKEREDWVHEVKHVAQSYSITGRPLLRRPTDPLPRPPPGQAEAETAGAPIVTRQEQSMWRFRLAARTIVLRVRADRRIAYIKDFLASVSFDKEQVAAAVAAQLPPPRKTSLGDATGRRPGTSAAPTVVKTKTFVVEGFPGGVEGSSQAAGINSSLEEEPPSAVVAVTTLFDPYDTLEVLPVADVRTERYAREALAQDARTRRFPVYSYVPMYTDMHLRPAPDDVAAQPSNASSSNAPLQVDGAQAKQAAAQPSTVPRKVPAKKQGTTAAAPAQQTGQAQTLPAIPSASAAPPQHEQTP